MAYDGMQMLQKHLHGSTENEENIDDKIINPKLKQFFEVQTKIEPFYSGGRIVALPGSRFVCKCGPTVKVVSTAENLVVKLEEPSTGSGNRGTEEQDEDIAIDNPCPKKCSSGILCTFECEMDEIISFDACPSTNTLITAHKSQLLRLWNIHTKEVIRTIKSFHTIPIIHTQINKTQSAVMKTESNLPLTEDTGDIIWGDPELLTWATVAGNAIKVWNAGGNQVSKQIKIDGVPSIGFIKWSTSTHNNNKLQQLFVAERNIYCIEQEAGTSQYAVTQTLVGHYSQVTGLEWRSNEVMISAGRDKIIIVWNISNGKFEKIKSLAFPGVIESTALLGMKNLYVGTLAGVIRHMDLDTFSITSEESLALKDGEEITLELHAPMNQGLDSESTRFFVSTHLCTIYEVRPSKSKKKKAKCALSIANQFVGSLEEILDLTLWDTSHVAVANNTAVIKVYNLTTGNCRFLRGHKDIVLSLSAYKEYLVSASKDNSIILWESGSDEPHKILEGHLASVTSVCFNPSSTKLRIYSVSEDNFLKSWSTDKCLKSTLAHENEIHSVDSSPNGLLIVTSSRDKSAKIWEAESLKLRGTLKGHKKSVWDAKFSKWDQLVITSSADTTLKVWNAATFECLKTLQGHQSSVLKAKFINGGLQAISTGSDGTIRVWDLRTCECLKVLENSDDKVWALDSTSEGSFIVTGSADSVLTIWKDTTDLKVKESLIRRKATLESEQKLQNVIQSGKWANAIKLAIDLRRPFALLRVIRSIPPNENHVLTKLVSTLQLEEKKLLLEYIEKWNTNTKTSTEAQMLLNIILRSTPPKTLTPIIKVSTLLPYAEKHYKRLLKVQQDVCIIKYLSLDKMLGTMTKEFDEMEIKIEPIEDMPLDENI